LCKKFLLGRTPHGECAPGFIVMATKWLDEHSDPDDETIKHYLSRRAACREVPDAVKSGRGSAWLRQAA
jgi:aerobic-type carbon monoxide dehydrogenase small subunit (CoxS/CutS family)